MTNEIILIKDKVNLEVKTVEEIIERMRSETNNFVIPEYQRDYVWGEKSVFGLLLSLYKDYPIGTMLLQHTPTSKTKLLDGLQRTFSLIKINDDPIKYITEEMVIHFFQNKADEKINDIDTIKNNFKSLDEIIKEYSANGNIIKFEYLKNHINNKKFTDEKKDQLNSFVGNFKEWMDNDFLNIKVPQISLSSNFSEKEASEVFGLVNSEGKGLNKFEILSAHWSNYPIKVEGHLFVKQFIERRINLFLEKINSSDTSNNLIEMGMKDVSPANFMYAIFEECIGRNMSLKNVFYKDEVLRTKSIEPIMSIFANYLNLKSIKKSDLKELGKKLRNEMKTDDDIDKIVEDISKAMSVVASSISIFNFLSTNGNNGELFNKLGISVSMITSMINSILIKIKSSTKKQLNEFAKYFEKWIIIDTIEGEYDSGSNNRAWKNFKDGKYYKNPDDKYMTSLKNHLDSEFKSKVVSTKPSSGTLMILSLLQHKLHRIDSINIDLDHIIPKSLLSPQKLKEKNYINTIGNLQLLDSVVNRETKRDKILPDENQYDFLFDNEITTNSISEDFKSEHNINLELMKTQFYKLDDNYNIVQKTKRVAGKEQKFSHQLKNIKLDVFIEFYEKRYKLILELIEEKLS